MTEDHLNAKLNDVVQPILGAGRTKTLRSIRWAIANLADRLELARLTTSVRAN
jgi:hypothetical protein